jgi:hypothetical protein
MAKNGGIIPCVQVLDDNAAVANASKQIFAWTPATQQETWRKFPPASTMGSPNSGVLDAPGLRAAGWKYAPLLRILGWRAFFHENFRNWRGFRSKEGIDGYSRLLGEPHPNPFPGTREMLCSPVATRRNRS